MEAFRSRSPLAKRMIIMIIILVILFGGIFAFNIIRSVLTKKFFAEFKFPPVTVSSAKATLQTWQPFISSVGTLVAVNGVNVTTQVPGQVVSINFVSGQYVRAGEPIIKLDDRLDQQDLINFQSQLALAKTNYQRQLDLLKTKSTSQSNVDSAYATLQQTQAQVAKILVYIDQKNIKAPFDGRIGIRQVNLGQYISPGTPLVSLQSLNPLYVQFALPEQHFKSLYVAQPIEMTVITYGSEIFKGKINAIDATISSQTRNILVQAVVPNEKYRLFPGMSAAIRVLLPTQVNVVTVPQTAVDFSLFGDSIFVITPAGKDKEGVPLYKVHRQFVTTGERRDNEVAITTGLKAGQEVVSSGQLKLDEGTIVKINNTVNLQALPVPSKTF